MLLLLSFLSSSFGKAKQPNQSSRFSISTDEICSYFRLYKRDVGRAANRPRVIWKSGHRDYTSPSCQNASESAHSKIKAAECDNRAALDGHVLTGIVVGDEQKDTHSPLLFGQKLSKLADLSVWYSRPQDWDHEPSNISLLKPATELLRFVFSGQPKSTCSWNNLPRSTRARIRAAAGFILMELMKNITCELILKLINC